MSGTDILFGFLPKFFYTQFFVTPPVPTSACTGKTIIVTGANVRSKRTARHLCDYS